MLDSTNCLGSDYSKNFRTHQMKEAVKQIPPDRRSSLAKEIVARANLAGCKDESALKVVLKLLRKEEPYAPTGSRDHSPAK